MVFSLNERLFQHVRSAVFLMGYFPYISTFRTRGVKSHPLAMKCLVTSDMTENRDIVFGLFMFIFGELLVASANLVASYLLRYSQLGVNVSQNHGIRQNIP